MLLSFISNDLDEFSRVLIVAENEKRKCAYLFMTSERLEETIDGELVTLLTLLKMMLTELLQ